MNLDTLLESYRQDNRLKALAERLATPGSENIQIKGLSGSASAFVIGALAKQVSDNHVIVLNDKEEAAYFQNDLINIIRELDIFYFPDSFKKTGDFRLMNSSHVMLRTEALMKLVKRDQKKVRRKILVTYPEALFEKVVPPVTFSSAMVKIEIGEELNTDA